MKIAYFDCSAGASGDMIVGALIDAGVTIEHLRRELAKLRLEGYSLRAAGMKKSGLAAVKFDVDLAPEGHGPESSHDHGHDHSPDHRHDHAHGHDHDHGHDLGHGHEHAHDAEHRHDHAHSHDHDHDHGRGGADGLAGRTVHRNLDDIVRIIDGSGLAPRIRERSKAVFRRLAEAEAKVHGCSVGEIHFHEVGAVDAIVDIVGSVIGLEALGVEEIRASALHVGSGFVDCAHGRLPVPPPAVTELLKGVPVYATEVRGELVTPTGAAILSTLASSFGPFPEMRILRTGTGAGFKDLPIPNVLRLVLGETQAKPHEDRIRLIETNIDDMNPQFYDHIMERLFAEGARDVFLTPIVMKKSRPGIILSVIAGEERTDALVEVLLRETTTLGVRLSDLKKRMVLGREVVTVPTRWGDADVKVRNLSGSERTVAPEYDHCKRLARETGLPLREVWDAVKRDAEAALPRAKTAALPRAKTGAASRAKTGTLPRAKTAALPRAKTGAAPRAKTGTLPRAKTGTLPRKKAGPVSRGATARDKRRAPAGAENRKSRPRK